MDNHLLFIQGILIIFQEVNFRWHISIKSTSIDSRHAWVTFGHISDQKKTSKVSLGLQKYGHSIPRSWMRTLDQMKSTQQ